MYTYVLSASPVFERIAVILVVLRLQSMRLCVVAAIYYRMTFCLRIKLK